MNVLFIRNEYELANQLVSFYNTAITYNASRVVLLNTFNPQSTLNENRFVVNILKTDENGNEQVAYMHSELLEVNDINIVYRGVKRFKDTDKYKRDIPIEIWSDNSSSAVYW